MKHIRKHIALFLALVLLCSAVSACTSNKPAETTPAPATTPGDTSSEPGTTDPLVHPHLPEQTYNGYEFVVLMTNLNADTNIVRDFAEPQGESVVDEALYRRNEIAMSKLNIKITGITDYKSTNSGVAMIRRANTSGDTDYNMGIISTYDCGTLTTSDDLRDLNEYGYLDLSQSWWDQNMNRDVTVNNRLHFTTGDISLVTTIAMYNMVFNKTMFRENGWEMPYDDVKNGTWTFDKMKSYIMAVSRDLNADDKMDSNDLYGMVYIHSTVIAALNMSGERFARVGEDGKIELTLGTERAENAIVDFIELTQDRDHVYNGQTATGGLSATGMFAEGHCLFRLGEHLMFPYYRDTQLDYGILPLPKFDESQDRYYTPFGGWDAAFVCVPNSVEDDEQNSAIMEYLAYISQSIVTPAYYTKTLVGSYVQDPESYDMITLEMQNRIFDIGYIYNIGNMKTVVEQLSKNYSTAFASTWRGSQRSAERALNKLNETLFKTKE